MVAIVDGTSNLVPFGLEFALILAALAFVVFVACVVPIAFEMRRQMMRPSWIAEMNRRADLRLDEGRRNVRHAGDLAARTNRVKSSRTDMTTFFKALLDR